MSENLPASNRRGITQRDVWIAVEAVVAQGRRPTIDAVGQHLGRGSPNTIQAHLDAWFAHLADRLGEDKKGAAAQLPWPAASSMNSIALFSKERPAWRPSGRLYAMQRPR